MGRKMSFAKRVGKSLKSKATNSAKSTAYMAMWGEPVPKGKKKS